MDPERYQYDGEVLAKAEELGKPGLVDIIQRQVHCAALCHAVWQCATLNCAVLTESCGLCLPCAPTPCLSLP